MIFAPSAISSRHASGNAIQVCKYNEKEILKIFLPKSQHINKPILPNGVSKAT